MFFRRLIKFYLRLSVRLVLKRHHPFIIAITGNTGKTSTKEAIYTVLENNLGSARKTPKNFNTDIGVPLAILGLKDAQRNIFQWFSNLLKTILVLIDKRNYPRYLILELAADKPGEIKYFTEFLVFDVVVITVIGKDPVHLKFFPSRDSLIQEKASILKALKNDGVAILNRDNRDVFLMARQLDHRKKIYFYGQSPKANLRISHIKTYLAKEKNILLALTIKYQGQTIRAKFKNLLGEGNGYAIGAALMCGLAMGISLKAGIKALTEHFAPIPGRLRVIKGIKSSVIIDDTYNASPLSYFNAIETIDFLDGAKRKILVLGDMAELDQNNNIRIHEEVLERAINSADIIFCVGPNMNEALKEAKKKRRTARFPEIYQTKTSSDVLATLHPLIRHDDLILVKGAQVMRMEKVVKGIMDQPLLAKKVLVRQEKRWT